MHKRLVTRNWRIVFVIGCVCSLSFPVTASVTGLPPCLTLATAQFLPRQNAVTVVSPKFALHKGPLQPQIERLLTAEFNVDTVDWQASPHHQWPTEFTVEAVSWRQVLGKILSAYKLQAVFYANRSAVIRYREQ